MPGNSCTVCKSSWNNAVSMFSPPRDEYMRAKWEAACGVKLRQSSRLCSKHFSANDFTSANAKRARLQPEAVPTLNFSKANVKSRKTDKSLSAIDSYRKTRASLEQLLFFVNFAQKHPKMLTTKFGAVSHLWEELARNLNSMDGACRSADKWKESMSTWRCQLRCRARRGKSSGVPQFDEFALWNFGQHSQNELDEMDYTAIKTTSDALVAEDTDVENMVKQANNMKDMLEMELCNIKTEIESSDDDNSHHEVSHTNAAPATTTGEEVDIKYDAELSDDSNPSCETHATNTVEDNPALSCSRTSRSKVFVIPRQTVSKEKKEKAKIFIIPRTSTQTTTDGVTRKQSKSTGISNKALTNTNGSTKSIIILPQSTNSATVAFSTQALPNADNIHATSTSVLSQTATTPEPQVRGNATTKKRKLETLNEMYETVLDSMKRRDKREEQFITVMQGLTDAVTRMADNVKRLEEVLSFCAKD